MNAAAWTAFVKDHRQAIDQAVGSGDGAAIAQLYRKARVRGVFKRETDLSLDAFKTKLSAEAASPFSGVDCRAPVNNGTVNCPVNAAPSWMDNPAAMDKVYKSIRMGGQSAQSYAMVSSDRFDDMLDQAWKANGLESGNASEFAQVSVSIKDRIKNVVNAARGKKTTLDQQQQQDEEEERGRVSRPSSSSSSSSTKGKKSRSRSKGKKSRSRSRSKSPRKGKKSRSRSRSKSPRKGNKSVKFAAVEGHSPSMYKRSATLMEGMDGVKYRALGDIVVCQHLTELTKDPNPALRVIMGTQSIFEAPVDVTPPAKDQEEAVKVRIEVMDAPRDMKSQHVREIKPNMIAKLDQLPDLKRSAGVSSIALYEISPAVPMASFYYNVDGGKVPLPIFVHMTVPHPGGAKSIQSGLILSRVDRATRRYGCTLYQCPSSGAGLYIILHFDRELDALTRVVLVQTEPTSNGLKAVSASPVFLDIRPDGAPPAISSPFSDFLSVECADVERKPFVRVMAIDYLDDQELETMANVEGLLDRFGITRATNDRAFILKAGGWKESILRGEAGPTLGALRDLVTDAIERSTGNTWGELMVQSQGETLDVELSAQSRTSGLVKGVLDRLRRAPPVRRSLPVHRNGQLCAVVLPADVLRALRLSSVRDLVDDKASGGVVRPVSAKLFIKTSVPRRNVPSGLKFQVAAESVEDLRRGTLETPAVLVGTFLRSAYGNTKANPNVDEGVILTMVAANAEGDFDKAVLYFVRAAQV